MLGWAGLDKGPVNPVCHFQQEQNAGMQGAGTVNRGRLLPHPIPGEPCAVRQLPLWVLCEGNRGKN